MPKFVCRNFLGFEFWRSSKFIFYLPQFFCKNLGRFLSYEVHHRSHCFVCHNFVFTESFWSSSKLLFANVYLKDFVYEFVSKFMSACVYFKALSTNVSQSSCLPMFVSIFFVYFCLRQSSCLPMYVSKLLSTTTCLDEFWKVYEFWSLSQAWFTLPYSICKNVSKVMNFQALQSSSFVCHSLFARNLEAFLVLKLITSHIVLSTIDCA